MDSLFTVPITSIMISLLALVAGTFAVLGWIAFRNPLLVRMGLRNIRRRAAQTTLIVVGLMLSTLIISAAFATGDTVGFSVTNTFYNALEGVDFIVGFDADAVGDDRPRHLTDDDLAALRDAFATDPDIDGITGISFTPLPVLNPDRRLSEPNAEFVGADPSTVGPFNGIQRLDGEPVDLTALTGNRTFIGDRLAKDIDAGAGDTVTLFVNNEPHDFEVLAVVRDTALTSSEGNLGSEQSGGLVVHLDVARELTDTSGELDFIVISITGGTRDTLDRSDAVQDRLEGFFDQGTVPAKVDVSKKQIIGIAELIGSGFGAIFLVFGLFSIAAGILLIFLIFIMLAAERRSEMGMARAVGMKRLHLTEMFLAEGMAYNVGSAAVGALLGLAVAYALVTVLGSIFGEFGLTITYHFNPQGFVIAYCLGVVLTFATVAFSSWRAANLNIVRAIRDLPEPQPLRGEDRSIGGLLQAAVGALWHVMWLAIIAIFVVVGVALFGLTISIVGGQVGTGGAGLLATALMLSLAAFMYFGGRTVRPGHFMLMQGWQRWMLWAAWLGTLLPVAATVWLLLLSKGWADRHRNAGGWAALMIVLGGLLVYIGGWVWNQAFAYTGGTTLAVLAIAMLAVYFGAGTRLAFSTAGLALVWYWLLPLPFSLLFEAGEGFTDPVDGVLRLLGLDPDPGTGNIEMFFVSGISITAAATLVVIFNAGVLLRVVSGLGGVLGGITPALRTAVAYPLAAKFRTAMTLSMFALVVFSLVVMSFINFNFLQLFTGEEATGGFDVVVDANANNRIPDLREALAADGFDGADGIDGVGTLVTALPELSFAGEEAEPEQYPLKGMDPEFLDRTTFAFAFRAEGYDSDAAVLEALRTDPTVAVVDASRFPIQGPFSDPDNPFELPVTEADLEAGPWQPLPLLARNVDTGEQIELKLIATLQPQATAALEQFFAVYTSQANIDRYFDGGEQETFFVTAVDRSNDATVTLARGIESTLLERGVQADSIRRMIDEQAEQSTRFQLLFEAFMGLGLVVGIAALGVIAFRTVVERRQQIGMLRAIGYSRRLVAVSFFLESSFIALTGIVMGVALGWALSYNLLSNPENIGAAGTEIDFQVPWLRLALIAGIAYGASALMTLIPARSASRVPVAEALRYE